MNRIIKFLKLITDNIVETLIFLLTLLNILPILAPILAKLGLYLPSKIIYTIYSFFCHQLHWRSLHVCDYQYGWCTRCTFMWISILISGIGVKFFKVNRIKWYWVIVLITPLALDGLVQTIATMVGLSSFTSISYMSSNFFRMITGSLFGLGFGLWIFSSLNEVVLMEKSIKPKNGFSLLTFSIITFLLTFIIYILMVYIWDISSNSYKPDNFIDLSVRTPVYTEDFIVRGKNAL